MKERFRKFENWQKWEFMKNTETRGNMAYRGKEGQRIERRLIYQRKGTIWEIKDKQRHMGITRYKESRESREKGMCRIKENFVNMVEKIWIIVTEIGKIRKIGNVGNILFK